MTDHEPARGASLSRVLSDAFGPRVRLAVPLGPVTTWRVGGPAAAGLEVEGIDDLLRLADVATVGGLGVVPVGRGSNLLVADRGVDAVAVWLAGDLAGLVIGAEDRSSEGLSAQDLAVLEEVPSGGPDGRLVVAGGGLSLPVLARRSGAAGLRGLEWAVGVPGSVGGAVRMNAGGHGGDVAGRLVAAQVVDLSRGQVGWRTREELGLGYRSSSVAETDVVVRAAFRLEPGDPGAAAAEMDGIVRWRREHQPGGRNAGSTFVNPPGDAAGRLIEAVGGKGLAVGRVRVSDKHANFLQAEAGARAREVLELMGELRRRVHARFGVLLCPEVQLVGFDAEELGLLEVPGVSP